MAKEKWIQGAIPKANKGEFTAKAKAAGKSVAEETKSVLKKGSKANSTLKHEAQFAKNMKAMAKKPKR